MKSEKRKQQQHDALVRKSTNSWVNNQQQAKFYAEALENEQQRAAKAKRKAQRAERRVLAEAKANGREQSNG